MQPSRRVGWADVIAVLVESGHSLNDLRHYTLSQIDVLARAHSKLARRRLRDACIAARAGQAESKAFAGFLKQLES